MYLQSYVMEKPSQWFALDVKPATKTVLCLPSWTAIRQSFQIPLDFEVLRSPCTNFVFSTWAKLVFPCEMDKSKSNYFALF